VRSVAKTKAVAKQAAKRRSAPAAKKQLPAAKQLPVAKKRPATAVKPARPTRPSLPLPPPPPAPPPIRDELGAPRDIGRLLRYGERFGAKKIDIRMLALQLPVASGALAIWDPGVPKSWRVLDRPVGTGAFRVMLSIARDGDEEALAAVTIHVGRPPITRWTVAHPKGQKAPKSADQLPRVPVTSGWLALVDAGSGSPGPLSVPATLGLEPVEVTLPDGRRVLALPCGTGEFAAYWAVDPTDKAVCLVLDFDAFTPKDWKARPS
jgi:hypothetical protein